LTSTTVRAASAAFAHTSVINVCHPASRMYLVSAYFAAAPFGRNAPGASGSGFGSARRTRFPVCKALAHAEHRSINNMLTALILRATESQDRPDSPTP